MSEEEEVKDISVLSDPTNSNEIDFVKDRFLLKYNNGMKKYGAKEFQQYWDEYQKINSFAPDGNIHQKQQISEEAHFIMQITTQYYLHKAFNAMKMDMNNANVSEDLKTGNIGTPGRIAKMWCGSNLNDSHELGGGRWSRKPRLAKFPNDQHGRTIPITKRVDIVSNCSHHFISFSTITNPISSAIISYIPGDFVLGISKLQRMADWISQRFYLQEDLTRALYNEMKEATQTDSVYIGLLSVTHGCEILRGSKSREGNFTSEYYGGAFNDVELRKQVKST